MRHLPSYAADYRFKVELSTARGEIVIHSEPQESAIGLVEIYLVRKQYADGRAGV